MQKTSLGQPVMNLPGTVAAKYAIRRIKEMSECNELCVWDR